LKEIIEIKMLCPYYFHYGAIAIQSTNRQHINDTMKFSTFSTIFIATTFASANADGHSGRSLATRMDALEAKNTALEAKNKELSSEVASLKSALMANGKDNLRGRALISDYLSDYQELLEQLQDITNCVSYEESSSSYIEKGYGYDTSTCYFGSGNGGGYGATYVPNVMIKATNDITVVADVDGSYGGEIIMTGDINMNTNNLSVNPAPAPAYIQAPVEEETMSMP